jgi:3-methyl-2-oxobutanoate hydroxymethyltransferase
MPFLSYQANEDMAIENAGKFLKAGATAVKLEGGRPIIPIVHRMVEAGIPVMGHLGLTPQSINQFGGHKVQGKTPAAAARILNDAQALEDAGAFALVLEAVPEQLALMVTRRLLIPTIGIGAGVNCDAQVQVLHDILGIYDDSRVFHHTKRYMNLGESIRNAVRSYADEVTQGSFPTSEHAFDMEEDVLHELTQASG